MTESDPAQELRSYFRGRREASGEHPTPEELAAYRDGALEPGREKGVRAHLLACQECSEMLLDLAALEASNGVSGEASEFEVEAAWRKQRQRLFPVRQRDLMRFAGWAAAACLAVVVAGLSYEIRDQRRTNVGFYELDLPRVIAKEGGQRGTGADLPVLELEADKPGLVLLLLQKEERFSSFRAEFLSQDGQSLWVRERLSATENLLLVQVGPHLLPAGVVRVEVSGLIGERYEPVEEYVLRVNYP